MKLIILTYLIAVIFILACTVEHDIEISENTIEQEEGASEKVIKNTNRPCDLTVELDLNGNKIAVASYGTEEDAKISYYVGRSDYFTIYDEKGEFVEAFANEYANMKGSPGSSVAEMLAEKGVKIVIGGQMGQQIIGEFEKQDIIAMKSCDVYKKYSNLS